MQAACLRVYELSQEMPKLAGMGTTLTAARLFPSGRMTFAHVGDSRAYRLRSGQLEAGLAVLSEVLDQVGLGLADRPWQAIAKMLALRAWLRVRGLGSRARPVSEVTPRDLLRIDSC